MMQKNITDEIMLGIIGVEIKTRMSKSEIVANTPSGYFGVKLELESIDENNFYLLKYSKRDTVYRISCSGKMWLTMYPEESVDVVITRIIIIVLFG